MKDLNLFSGLVSAENLNLGYGLIEENKEMTDEEIKIDLIQKAQITNALPQSPHFRNPAKRFTFV